MENAGNLVGSLFLLCLVVGFLVIAFGSIAWTWIDANRRGKAGCLWALIAWFTWPFGVIAYVVLRDREVRL
jgi:hypothetical protein